MNELHLFAGAGGGILGGMLLGHTCVCAVEIEPYCRRILLQRQRDGILPKFPIWDDVRTFDGKPWTGHVDVVCGGFPCQDISAAGKGLGIDGERSGLWREMARIASEIRPRFLFVENSPLLVRRGLATVLADIAAMGFDAKWGIVSASNAGAPHERERLWIVARDPNQGHAGGKGMPERSDFISEQRHTTKDIETGNLWKRELGATDVATGVASYSDALRILHGMADRVDRLESIGNGQVPSVAKLAWEILGATT